MKLQFAACFLAVSAMRAADPVPMDVKPGQWEATVTSHINGLSMGMPQLPPEQLAKLPPEQRARIEAMLKGSAHTSTSKSCVKKEDLGKMNFNKDQSCKTTLVSSSGSKQEIHMECDHQGDKQTGTITIQALNSESIKFNIQTSGTSNGKSVSMTIDGTSKWLGPVCEDSK